MPSPTDLAAIVEGRFQVVKWHPLWIPSPQWCSYGLYDTLAEANSVAARIGGKVIDRAAPNLEKP